MLEFFSLENALPIVLLILVLHVVGHQMGGNNDREVRVSRGIGVAAFLLVGAMALSGTGGDAWEMLAAAGSALLAMGLLHSVGKVLTPVGFFLHYHTVEEPREKARKESLAREGQEFLRQRDREEQEEREAILQRQAEMERAHAAYLASLPPPPTRDELMATAKDRYEAKVRALEAAGLDDLELAAGKEKAKQDYLREIDEAMR